MLVSSSRRIARTVLARTLLAPCHKATLNSTSETIRPNNHRLFGCTCLRSHSSSAVSTDNDYDPMGPEGDLFSADVGPSLVGKKAQVRRIFGPRANSIGLLTAGGEALAKHASFDPQYYRARDWIRTHAVGPAVLSPVLISGLVGALVEAACPQSIPISCSMQQIRPLIVGVRREDLFGLCDTSQVVISLTLSTFDVFVF